MHDLDIRSPNDSQLVVVVYGLSIGLGTIVYGPLMDRYGRKPVLLAGLAGFALSSALAAVATSLTMLLVARTLQGVSIASARVGAVSVIRDRYHGPSVLIRLLPKHESANFRAVISKLPFPTSLPDFMRLFPDDATCATYLEKVRWPDAFVCQYCKWRGEPWRFPNRSSVVLRCRGCLRDTSLTADTVMQRTHTPISIWFWAAYLVSSQTPGMSAVQFQRQLGLKRYETAFQILHKLRVAMVRPDRDRIGGDFPVEVDETWVGGRTRGEGRGRHHKTLVVGAIEERKRKKNEGERDSRKALPRRGGLYAGRLRLHIAPDRSAQSLESFVIDSVQPGTQITTDDWSGYDQLAEKGYHLTQVAQCGDPDITEKHLPLIHLVFGNLKTWLNGVHHGVSPQHLQAYLNEFTFRFNRRFFPFNAFQSLLGIGATMEPTTYAALYKAGHRPKLPGRKALIGN